MIRSIVAPLALALIVTACGARAGSDAEPAVGYRMSLDEVGDTAWYHLQNEAVIRVVQLNGDSLITRPSEDYVLELTRTAPDTVIAFFDHIRIMANRNGRIIPVPMETLYGQDFVLTEAHGRLGVRTVPEVARMEPSVRETARLLDEMFFEVPSSPMTSGLVWVDTLNITYDMQGARYERENVSRYEVVGDTVLHGVQAKVIRYESALDNLAVRLDDDSVRTVLIGTETGTIVYSPARRIILFRQRDGRLDGYITVPSPDGHRQTPHSYDFSTRIDLLPPRAEG